jgi:uncharacterized membrane protein YhhN
MALPLAKRGACGKHRVQKGKLMVRTIWWAALIAGATYMIPVWASHYFTIGFGEAWQAIAWKGAGVGLLALWAGLQARNRDGWLITAILALGALGDVLLDAVGLRAGAIAFAAGHVVAIGLYLLNRRSSVSGSQRLLGIVTIPTSIIITIAALGSPGSVMERLGAGMARDGGSDILPVLIYAAIVAAMASAAWGSRFPRYRTGIGAMMFLASDLLIFARMGVLSHSALPGLLIWPLYFCGQALIAWGVVTTLRNDPER